MATDDGRGRGAISRRQFITVSAIAGGGALIAVSPPGRRLIRRLMRREPVVDPRVFVAIHPDDTIIVTIPKSEMGQGVRTSLAMLVADEMDADWSKVRVETAPFGTQYGFQGTSGSLSIADRFLPLRQAGAAARAMLVAAAARELGVSERDLAAAQSSVRHASSGRAVTYGALASRIANATPPRSVSLKARRDWHLVGTNQPGKDVPDIVRGTAVYASDVRVPGMRFASIERSRDPGASVQSFDASAALRVPGVLQAVKTSGVDSAGVAPGVAIIATNTWAAMEGRRLLKIEWTPAAHADESSESYSAFMRDAVAKTGSEIVHRVGDPDGLLSRAASTIGAEYEVPFLAHVTMEPMICTASVANGKAELWAPAQVPDIAVNQTARALGISPSAVALHITLLGGGFGRRINADYAVEAALLSHQIGAPVQVVWTRDDDVHHDVFRPCAMHRFDAVLGADGMPTAWRHRLVSAAIAASGGREPAGRLGLAESQSSRNAIYRVPNRSSEYTLLPSSVARGWWRSVHSSHGVFAVESFIDELAAAAKRDPIEYRLALADRPPTDPYDPAATFEPERLEAVLRLAAEKAQWSTPRAGRFQGVACAFERQSYVAEIVEISMNGRIPRVERVIVAVDCGLVVNPSGARAQIEGGVLMALSAALGERITVAGGRVQQSNFHDYRVLSFADAPPVEISFVTRDDVRPTGLGEVPVPPLAPALANAIVRATGKRPRTLPIV